MNRERSWNGEMNEPFVNFLELIVPIIIGKDDDWSTWHDLQKVPYTRIGSSLYFSQTIFVRRMPMIFTVNLAALDAPRLRFDFIIWLLACNQIKILLLLLYTGNSLNMVTKRWRKCWVAQKFSSRSITIPCTSELTGPILDTHGRGEYAQASTKQNEIFLKIKIFFSYQNNWFKFIEILNWKSLKTI